MFSHTSSILFSVSEGRQEKHSDMDFLLRRRRREVVHWQREAGAEEARVDEGVARVPSQVGARGNLVINRQRGLFDGGVRYSETR